MKPMKNLLLMGLLSALGPAGRWPPSARTLRTLSLATAPPSGRRQGVSFRRGSTRRSCTALKTTPAALQGRPARLGAIL